MARTITGGDGTVATITSAITLIATDDPLLITTGAQGAMGIIEDATFGAIYGDDSQAWSITNEGTIKATAGIGVTLKGAGIITNGSATHTDATIYGSDTGIIAGTPSYNCATATFYFTAPSTITNDGTITGAAYDGIRLRTGGTVINGTGINTAALISGGKNGVNIGIGNGGYANGPGTVTNQGTILGNGQNGVYLAHGGTVTNNGTAAYIYGHYTGIDIENDPNAVVTNQGTIASDAQDGVILREGGTFTNSGTAALVSGGYGGIHTFGGYSALTVINDGTVTAGRTASSTFGAGFTGGTLTNGSPTDTFARIYGYGYGIVAGPTNPFQSAIGDAVIVNDGTVVGVYKSGIQMLMTGTVTNGSPGNALAHIQGGQTGIYASAAITVTNSGTIGAYRAISLLAGGTITNTGTDAVITGSGIGIYTNHTPATVTNQGTILGTGTFSSGIVLLSGGSITNQGTASYIGGQSSSVFAAQGGTIANEGTIVSQTESGIENTNGRMKVVNGSAGNTTARLEGGFAGAYIHGAVGMMSNFGTIAGGVDGLAMAAGHSTVTNRGLISGAGVVGVYLKSGGILTNTGTITGSMGVRSGNSPTTLISSGTIIGTSGIAIQLGNASDLVVITSAAVFTGVVDPGLGADVLALNRGGNNTFSGLGSTFIGFETLTVADPTAKLKLSGANSLQDNVNVNLTGNLTVIAGSLNVLGQLNLAAIGTIGVTATGAIEIGTTGSLTAGKIAIASDGVLRGQGTLKGAVVDNGLISITGGTLTTLGSLSGSGIVALRAGSALAAHGPVFVSSLVFAGAGTNETLVADKSVTSVISGFADNDAIDLTHFLANPALSSFAANTLTLDNGAGGHATLHFAPGYSIADFDIAPDGSGGTSIVHHL